MFKIVAAPTFTCAVRLSRPDADAPVEIEVTWRHKNLEQLAAWRAAAAAGGMADVDILDQVMVGWTRVLDEADKPLDYSREALAVLLSNFPAASQELYAAYVKRLADARAKN